MICDKKVLTVAILTAVSSIGVHAETINHTINETLLNDWSNGVLSSAYTEIVGADVTYTGTGKEDLVMTQIEGNRGGRCTTKAPSFTATVTCSRSTRSTI